MEGNKSFVNEIKRMINGKEVITLLLQKVITLPAIFMNENNVFHFQHVETY